MSKVSLKIIKQKLADKKKKRLACYGLKPCGFCCSAANIDPLTKYDKLTAQYEAMRRPVYKIHESPTLKLNTQIISLEDKEPKKKHTRSRIQELGEYRRKNYMRSFHNLKSPRFQAANSNNANSHRNVSASEDFHDNRIKHILEGPLKWYLEDEIEMGKDTLWENRQRMYNEEMDRNTKVGKKKSEKAYLNLANVLQILAKPSIGEIYCLLF